MGLAVLEPAESHHVPGTVTLDQSAAGSEQANPGLKRGSAKDSNIVLVPQPSNDPNDPLRWSPAKKTTVFGIILMGTAIICVIPAPMLNAGIVDVSVDLGRSFSDIAKLNGYMLLAIGAVSPFASALARKYGKRPVFVASSVIGLIGCIVAEVAPDYPTLVAGRLLQGVGASAYESLCSSVVTDIYFVHERGFYTALVVFSLSGLSNGVSVLAGLITSRLGWRYNFHILLPFVVLQTIMVTLFVPETVYNRSSVFNIDRLASNDMISENGEKATEVDHRETGGPDMRDEEAGPRGVDRTETETPLPKSFRSQLALYNGTFTNQSLWSMALASFVIMGNLIASYNIVVSGLILAWLVAMSVLAGVIFAAPPWTFDAETVGFVSAGPLVGGAVATIFLTLTFDPLIKALARRNNGVYEPEFRLTMTAIGGVFCVAGLIGFGHAIDNQQSIYTIATIWGITLFGMSIAAGSSMAYALDSHPAHAVEIFIMNITFKNFFFYGLTNFIIEWYTEKGAAEVFDVIGGMTAFLILLTVPMYVYGKRYRLYWAHHNLLVKLGLDEDPAAAR